MSKHRGEKISRVFWFRGRRGARSRSDRGRLGLGKERRKVSSKDGRERREKRTGATLLKIESSKAIPEGFVEELLVEFGLLDDGALGAVGGGGAEAKRVSSEIDWL